VVGQELAGKISDIHHGLDLRAYQPVPSANDEKPIVLTVGQLDERKGFAQSDTRVPRSAGSWFGFVSATSSAKGRRRADLEALIGH